MAAPRFPFPPSRSKIPHRRVIRASPLAVSHPHFHCLLRIQSSFVYSTLPPLCRLTNGLTLSFPPPHVGVSMTRGGKFRAAIIVNGTTNRLGAFFHEVEAALAYDK